LNAKPAVQTFYPAQEDEAAQLEKFPFNRCNLAVNRLAGTAKGGDADFGPGVGGQKAGPLAILKKNTIPGPPWIFFFQTLPNDRQKGRLRSQ
jgi:hypothetical protein